MTGEFGSTPQELNLIKNSKKDVKKEIESCRSLKPLLIAEANVVSMKLNVSTNKKLEEDEWQDQYIHDDSYSIHSLN